MSCLRWTGGLAWRETGLRKLGAGWSSRVSVLRRAGGRKSEREAARRGLIACTEACDERGQLLQSDGGHNICMYTAVFTYIH